MGLPSDLTSQHAKLDANISIMRGHLETADHSSPEAREIFEKLQPWTEQIGEMLHGYVHEEQKVILKQAGRILGESLEEIAEINDHTDELLDRFERFCRALADIDGERDPGGALAETRERFDEFIACFERHRDAERNFYSLYSTILFPSGAATD